MLWTVGGEYFPALDQAGRLLALRTEFIDWLVVVLGTGYPPQMTPYAIGLGVLMFATAFAAAFAVYRHHRVLDAIVLLGAALIVNMSAILTDLFYQLLLFVVAATAALAARRPRRPPGRLAAAAGQRDPRGADGDHAVGDHLRPARRSALPGC